MAPPLSEWSSEYPKAPGPSLLLLSRMLLWRQSTAWHAAAARMWLPRGAQLVGCSSHSGTCRLKNTFAGLWE